MSRFDGIPVENTLDPWTSHFCIASVQARLYSYSQFWVKNPCPADDELQSYIESMDFLEYQVAQFLSQPETAPLYVSHQRYRAFFLAVRLFINQALRSLPLGSDTMRCQAILLRKALPANMEWQWGTRGEICNYTHSLDVDTGLPDLSHAILWTILVGGVSSTGAAGEEWFAKEVCRACIKSGLCSWDATREAMCRLAFVEKICEGPWSKLWRDSQMYLRA
jgi:hypothetical protein